VVRVVVAAPWRWSAPDDFRVVAPDTPNTSGPSSHDAAAALDP